jgi:hypothetical protein
MTEAIVQQQVPALSDTKPETFATFKNFPSTDTHVTKVDFQKMIVGYVLNLQQSEVQKHSFYVYMVNKHKNKCDLSAVTQQP